MFNMNIRDLLQSRNLRWVTRNVDNEGNHIEMPVMAMVQLNIDNQGDLSVPTIEDGGASVTISNTDPIPVDIGAVGTLNVNLESLDAGLNPLPVDITNGVITVGGTVAVSSLPDVVIDDSTPVDINITNGTVTIGGTVVIDDSTPVDINLTNASINTVVTSLPDITIDDSTPVDINVTNASLSTTVTSLPDVTIDDSTPVDINVTNATLAVTLPTNPLDVNITNGSITVTGTVAVSSLPDVTIDDSTPVDINVTNASLSTVVTSLPDVTIDDSTPVDINVTNGVITVGGTVAVSSLPDVVIDDSTPVDINVTNANLNVTVTSLPNVVIDDSTPVDVAVTNTVTVDDTGGIDVNVISGGGGGSLDFQPNDLGSFDAFARLRVGNPETIFQSTQLVDRGEKVWSRALTGGSSVTVNNSVAFLDAPGNGDTLLNRTRQRMPYQAGKSQLILMTFNFLGSPAGTFKKLGYYDDEGGIGLKAENGTVSVFKDDTLGSDQEIDQSSWNIDRLDGSGPSGITVDWTRAQIFFMDLEWLGVGRIRYGFFFNGLPHYVHEITNFNALTAPYMLSANLPLTYELSNTAGGTCQMSQICSAVISEGGKSLLGLPVGVSNGTLWIRNNDTTNYRSLVAFRLKAGNRGSIVRPTRANVICDTNAFFEWIVGINPTVVSADQFSNWVGLDGTGLEYDLISSESTVNGNNLELSNDPNDWGCIIARGYGTTSQDEINFDNIPQDVWIGFDAAGTPDILTLAIRGINGVNEDFYGSMVVREET